jgi:Peptidase family M23/Bacterial Ig domain/Abnormal spindle-like microcephaly-assoc'd, ASPM-SPD-2-Hydin
VDVDSSAGILDYHGTNYTYNGHRGIDSDLCTFSEQTIGVPVFAVLDGVVTVAHDGEFDMRTSQVAGAVANFVVLNHGGTQETWYYHLKNGSVTVSVGDTVKAGQQLGLTASSGFSTGPHLHFESRNNGAAFEPFTGSQNVGASAWVNQPAFREEMYVRDFNITTQNLNSWVGPPVDTTRTGTLGVGLQAFRFWGIFQSLPASSNFKIRFLRPNGTVRFDSGSEGFGSGSEPFHKWSYWWWDYTINFDVEGTWILEFSVNGTVAVQAPLRITSAAATNRAPVAISASFDPPQASAGDVIFARVPFHLIDDPDYDVVRYRYQWQRNGSQVRDSTNAALGDALAAGTCVNGDVLTCTVTPSDGITSGTPVQLTMTVGAGLVLAEIVVEDPSGALTSGTASRDFGSQPVGGSTAAVTYTIRNTGTAVLTGLALTKTGGHASDFAVSSLGGTTLAPGADATFTLAFAPQGAGARAATLRIASNDADENPFLIALAGSGTTMPEIAVEQPVGIQLANGPISSRDFGTINQGNASPLSFTIRNTGSAVLTSLAITTDGTNSADFALSNLGVTSLSPNASATFTASFSPSANGPRTAAIHIASNDSDENPFTIALTGTGAPPLPAIPTAVSLAASNITGTTATVAGSVDPRHGDTVVTFEYGLLTSYGSSIVAAESPLSGTGARLVGAVINGLQGHTLYHYRVRAVNSAGSANGTDKTFVTPNSPPNALTDSVTALPGNVLTIAVLGNDFDADGDALKLVSVRSPAAAAGTAKVVGNNIVFNAGPAFTGTSFSYTISDGFGGTATGLVVINLEACMLSPVATAVLAPATSYTVAVTTTGTWLTADTLSWATVSPTLNSGNGSATVTLLANASKASRSGVITIGGKAHSIIQAGTLGFTIEPPPTIPMGMVSADYSLAIPSLQVPVTFSATGLPSGLTIGKTSGVISGKPNLAGSFKVSITGTTAAGASTKISLPLIIQPLPMGTVGSFTAWLSRGSALNSGLGGFMTLAVASSGSLTGTLKWGAASYTFKSRLIATLAGNPSALVSIARPSPAVPLTATLVFDGATNTMTGSVTDGTDPLSQGSLVSGRRSIWTATAATAYAATYNSTADLPLASLTDPAQPLGVGWEVMTVARSGTVKGTGRTADGIAYTFGGPLWPDGSIPHLAVIYGGRGSVMALPRITLGTPVANNRVVGWVDTLKIGPASTTDRSYRTGIPHIERTLDGAPWIPPTTAAPIVLGLADASGNAQVVFTGGEVELANQFASLAQTLRVNRTNTTTFAAATLAAGNPCRVNMTITASKGLFSGSFVLTDMVAGKVVLRTVNYHGIMLSHRGRGYAYFTLPGLLPSMTNSNILGGRALLN